MLAHVLAGLRQAGAAAPPVASEAFFVGTAVAGPRDRRIVFVFVAALLLACAAVVPYAATPWPVLPAFVPAYNAALIIIDALTALLLFGQYRELRERSLLVLACGYLFTSIAVSAHALSFPNAFGREALIGGSQTTAWLWLAWHGLFPCFIAGYAIAARRERRQPARARGGISAANMRRFALVAVLLTVALAATCIAVATVGHDYLPILLDGDRYITGVTRPVLSIAWVTTLTALGMLLWGTRARRLIDLWLVAVLCIWLIHIALSALLITGRFQVGFYVGRVYSLLAMALVLGLLLKQTLSLYGRLVRALRAEREHARRAEEAQTQVRASKQQLSLVMETAPVAILYLDAQQRVRFANQLYLDRVGKRADAVTGKAIRETLGDIDYEKISPYLAKALQGEPQAHEARIDYQAVGKRDIYVRYAPVKDAAGQVQGLVAAIEDITERKAAEEGLRKSEEHLRRALGIETVGVIFFDPAGRLTDANETFLQMSGYSRADVLEGKVRWDIMTPTEFMPVSLEALRQLKTEGRAVPYEKQYIRKDGSRWWGLFAATLLRPDEGVEFIVDVTERRQAEEALKESNRHKDEFLATLSHELRNPLAAIHNSLAVLHRSGCVGENGEPLLEIMNRQTDNLVRLVDDLLEMSRLSRGVLELRTEPVELAAVVRSAVEASRPLLDAGQHQLSISLPPAPITFEADSFRLSQVIGNLLNNAAKYTAPGGQIALSVYEEANELVISVRDNGIGIPADMLSRIFQMFVQVERDHRRVQGGLGIGLTLVKKLVELHGGTVAAKSAGVGKGSEFVARLPLVRSRAPAMRVPDADAAMSAVRTRRILVVDDNPDAAKSLANLLETMGNEVEVVLDGESALKALDAQSPQVVFLDLGMPGMSGYDVADRIARNPAYDDITLVAVTGWGQDDDRRRTRAAGFDHHLVKPVEIAAVEELLSRSVSTPSAGAAQRM